LDPELAQLAAKAVSPALGQRFRQLIIIIQRENGKTLRALRCAFFTDVDTFHGKHPAR
jgi:hypothetical protein